MFDLSGLVEGVEGVEELKVWEDTEEIKIRITDVREGTDKNQRAYIMPQFEIAEEDGYKEFSKFIHVPDKDWMDKKKLDNTYRVLKRIVACFDLDIGSIFDDDGQVVKSEWEGHEGWVVLGTDDDEKYGRQNYVKKFVESN